MTTRPLAQVLGLGSAAAFAAFPLVRPWGDKSEDAQAMVDAFASSRWLISHSLGMIAWVLLTATLVSLASTHSRFRMSAWVAGIGTAAILPYYGAETFGLHGLASAASSDGDIRLVSTAQEMIRSGAAAATCFGLGLLLLAAAGVAIAVTTWRSSRSRRWLAIPAGVGLLTYLPQFFAPDAVRQAHGLALGIAIALWLLLRDGSLATPAAAKTADRGAAAKVVLGERS